MTNINLEARCDAAIQLEWALRLEPENSEFQRTLGVVFFRQGDPAKADFHLEESLRIMPGFARAHNNLAFVLYADGKSFQFARPYMVGGVFFAHQLNDLTFFAYDIMSGNFRAWVSKGVYA